MNNHPVNETLDIASDWFLPEKPDQIISGRLCRNNESIELFLNEAFTPIRGTIKPGDEIQRYSTIFGTSVNGEALTLMNAIQLSIAG